ncbi:unnamed protein product [Lactuca saligna]|uniref:Uncharacterized protein n=1 Tax=Lactuca saligna TaxID=75948 RepID=A0AA35V4U2_LACSI|nr:unnamed protein product [Lactuca saligna]
MLVVTTATTSRWWQWSVHTIHEVFRQQRACDDATGTKGMVVVLSLSKGSSARMAVIVASNGGWVARDWRTADLSRPTSSSATTGGVVGFSQSVTATTSKKGFRLQWDNTMVTRWFLIYTAPLRQHGVVPLVGGGVGGLLARSE